MGEGTGLEEMMDSETGQQVGPQNTHIFSIVSMFTPHHAPALKAQLLIKKLECLSFKGIVIVLKQRGA